MSCNLTGGYQLPACIFSQAGIQRLYISNFSASTFTNSTLDVDNVITQVDPTATFYIFDLIQETGSFNTTIPTNIQNASQFYESVVDLVIGSNNPTLRNQLLAMASSPMNIIVETRSNQAGLSPAGQGDFYFVGATMGCWNNTGKLDSGKASGDFHGWNLTFQAKEPVSPYFISGGTASFTSSY